jgi:hypothetical protein
MRLSAVMVVLGIAACGGREAGPSTPASSDASGSETRACPTGEQLCTLCDGTQSCVPGVCIAAPCPTKPPPLDAGCHEGEVGCQACDGGRYCAIACIFSICPVDTGSIDAGDVTDADLVTTDGAVCAPGQTLCSFGCHGDTLCSSSPVCPEGPPC